MGYASKDIRNILVAGHAGCGKTTLTEALLYMSGATERMGRVEDGTTASDFDPEETRRKASLNASVVPVEYEGIKYNLIDAPGPVSYTHLDVYKRQVLHLRYGDFRFNDL